MTLAWPWVGRAEELQRVRSALRGTGGGRGVVIAGAPGVGKTRLAAEAVAAQSFDGHATRWLVATTSSRSLPFGVFAELDVSPGPDPIHMVRAILDALPRSDGDRSAVVAVDDAHRLDDQSAFVIHQMVHRRLASVLLTVRVGEPAPEAVTALWKDNLLERLELPALTAEETATVMSEVLGAPMDRLGARRIWALTGGNMLYLRRLVDDERAAGRLREVAGTWFWSGDAVVSTSLAELVSAQIGRLAAPIADVVDHLAVAEPLPLRLLRLLTDDGAVEQAESAGLVTVSADGRAARLAHPLYGEVRRARMGVLRAERLRGAIAAALAHADATGTDDELLRRAVLTVDSDIAPDPGLFLDGARVAFRRMDLPLAERLAAASVASGGTTAAHLARALALSLMSRGEEARDLLVTIPLDHADPSERALVAMVRAANLFFDLGQPAAAEEVLGQADGAIGDAVGAGVVAATWALVHATLGRPRDALDAAGRAAAAGLPLGLPAMLAAWGETIAHGDQGAVDSCVAAADRGYAIARQSVDAAMLRFALGRGHVGALVLAGHLEAAQAVAADLAAQSEDLAPSTWPLVATLLGHCALGRGDLHEAMRLLSIADQSFDDAHDTAGWSFMSRLDLTRTLASSGRHVAAAEMLEKLGPVPHPSFAHAAPQLVLAHGWVTAAQGATSAAARLAREAADLARHNDQAAVEVLALHTAARFGDRGVADRLATLAASVDAPSARAAASHGAALAADDGAGLRATSELLEQLGDRLAAADAAAQASVAHQHAGLR
ncbi:AAA family ATPase, partial [Cellulomonas sp. P5_C6]